MSSTRPIEPPEEIRFLGPRDVPRLAAFFTEIADDRYFRPHAFDEATAREICCAETAQDVYLAYFFGGTIVAYGFLRGWDEGHYRPSLGLIVHPSYRGAGRGRMMMAFMHGHAMHYTDGVRLRVHPQNVPARRLYDRLGYVFDGTVERGELVGIYTFPEAEE